MKRVAVCGGWDFQDAKRVWEVLDQVHEKRGIAFLIDGRRPTGADKWARQWRDERGVPGESYGPDWFTWGQQAEAKRDEAMIEEGKPDAVILFGQSSACDAMLARVEAAGLPFWKIEG
jgi:hypothetical protein